MTDQSDPQVTYMRDAGTHYHPCNTAACAPFGVAVVRPPTAPVYDVNGRRVYLTSYGTFVISEHGQWLPGSYADLAAAMAAFDLDDEVLVELRDAAGDQPVTFAAVRARTQDVKEATP